MRAISAAVSLRSYQREPPTTLGFRAGGNFGAPFKSLLGGIRPRARCAVYCGCSRAADVFFGREHYIWWVARGSDGMIYGPHVAEGFLIRRAGGVILLRGSIEMNVDTLMRPCYLWSQRYIDWILIVGKLGRAL